MNRSAPQQDESLATDDAIARHRDELKKRFPLPSPQKKAKRPAPGTLGALLVALGLASGLLWLDPAYRTERYASARGQIQTVELVDGSVVTLDGDSQIEVGWHLRTRRVELHKGQALFDVAPASYRPFLTLAGSTTITVVGTRYSVGRIRDNVRITVEEGKVKVGGNDAALLLEPGDQLRVRHGQLGEPTRVDARAAAAWVAGRLVFNGTPLAEVLDAIARQQGIRVRLNDSDLAELPVSGTFDRAHLDGLLALLPKVLPVELGIDSDGAYVLSRREPEK